MPSVTMFVRCGALMCICTRRARVGVGRVHVYKCLGPPPCTRVCVRSHICGTAPLNARGHFFCMQCALLYMRHCPCTRANVCVSAFLFCPTCTCAGCARFTAPACMRMLLCVCVCVCVCVCNMQRNMQHCPHARMRCVCVRFIRDLHVLARLCVRLYMFPPG